MLGTSLLGWKRSIGFGLPLIVFMASIVWLSPLAVGHEDEKPNSPPAVAMARARSAVDHFRQSAIQSRILPALPTALATHDI